MDSPRPGRRRTIGGKLKRLVVVSIGIAVLVVTALSCWSEADAFLRSKRAVMLATANVFASATSRAVADGETAAVTQAIRAIARIPGFIYASVRDQDGKALAEIGGGARLAADLVLRPDGETSPLGLLRTGTLTVEVPIVDGGRTVGMVELVSDTTGLADGLATTLLRALLGSAAALAVGLAFALRLQRSITRPIEELARAMVAVERTGTAAPPAAVLSDDETGLLALRFNSMIGEIRAATARILDREQEIVERLGKAGELRDDQTGQHVVRVAKISRIIAGELGLAPDYIDDLCRASPMHDVGKISIPDAILHKPGRLDPDERRRMEEHALRGYEILEGSNSELVRLAAEIAISHHEKWDGTGYPRRIAGAAIPLSGRITAVADVCDALLSERPYKQPWPLAKVRELLVAETGSHFDPSCVDALLARWAELERIYPSEPGTAKAA